MTSNFAAGEKVAAARLQEAPLPDRPRRGRRVPLPRRVRHPRRRSSAQREGVVVRSTKGSEYTALRPTLEDFVVEMPRGAQVIYPKDLGPICMLADIGPGVRVFESGVGSGRAVDDDAALGRGDRRLRDPRGLRQPGPQATSRASSATTRSSATTSSIARQLRGHRRRARSVRPRRARPPRAVAGRAARRGGAARPAASSWPTRRRSPRPPRCARRSRASWIDARTIEVLHRGWHIEGQAVRPDHRMVAHTGFLSVARFLGRNET